MNTFYHIVEPNEPLLNQFILVNNLKTVISPMIIGFSHHEKRLKEPYHIKDKSYPKTSDDFDKDMAYKIVKFKPSYEVDTLLNYHLDYYTTVNNGDKQLFIKHIEYVVIERLKKIGNSDVYVTLIQNWIATHQTYKPSNTQPFMNNQINGNGNIINAGVKNSTININTDKDKTESIETLKASIAVINTQLEVIKAHLSYDEYETLTDDLAYANKVLIKPNADIAKIKPSLLSVTTLLNNISIDKIAKAIETIEKIFKYF